MLKTCIHCGARASVMRREYVENGSEPSKSGDVPGAVAKFRPTEAKWFCARHAPARVIPDSEFMESR